MQASPTRRCWNAHTVVGNAQHHIRRDSEAHLDAGRLRMPSRVGQAFPQNGDDVLG